MFDIYIYVYTYIHKCICLYVYILFWILHQRQALQQYVYIKQIIASSLIWSVKYSVCEYLQSKHLYWWFKRLVVSCRRVPFSKENITSSHNQQVNLLKTDRNKRIAPLNKPRVLGYRSKTFLANHNSHQDLVLHNPGWDYLLAILVAAQMFKVVHSTNLNNN